MAVFSHLRQLALGMANEKLVVQSGGLGMDKLEAILLAAYYSLKWKR